MTRRVDSPDWPSPTLDDQYLHHLREAAYDWGIEPLAQEPLVARRAAIVLGRNVVTLIDEVRRLRALGAEDA
jgi:hypothetical protein